MPLDYRLAMAAPQERFGTLKDIMAIGQLHDQDRQQQQARIDADQQRQADAIVQQVLTQYPDQPDMATQELKRRGMHKAAMGWETYVAEHRKKLAETARYQAETKIKELEATGQSPDQLLKAQVEFAKNATPKNWAPLLAAAAELNDQAAWDDSIAGANVMMGNDPRVKQILATIPKTPNKAWVSALLGADDPQRAAGAGTDYAQFLARYAAGLNKKPEQLTAEEEIKAKQEFTSAGRAAGGGEPFEVFLADQMEGEAAKLGKTPQQLGPSWRAGQAIKARKVWEAANDAPVRAGATTLSPTAESNIINRLSTQWMTASKGSRELDRAVALMDTGLTAARRGDMAQGAQAVLVTFQKILDPTSVVRESEYARSASGLALLDQIQGAYERLAKGGAGVPITELEKFGRLAKEMAEGQRASVNAVRSRLNKTAERYNIPTELVTDEMASAAAPAPAAAAAAQRVDMATAPKNPTKGQTWNLPTGQTAVWDGSGWVVK